MKSTMKFVVFVAMFVCATAYASAADKSAKDWMEIYKVYMEGPANGSLGAIHLCCECERLVRCCN